MKIVYRGAKAAFVGWAALASLSAFATKVEAAPSAVASATYVNGSQTITYSLWNAGSDITWETANADAIASGLQLASEHNTGEALTIGTLAADYPTAGSASSAYTVDTANNEEGPYIGGYRLGTNSSFGFAWSDGSTFDYTNWAPNEPDDYGGTENYINLFADGSAPITGPLTSSTDRGAQWNDVGEDASPFYITESIATTPSSAPEPATYLLMAGGLLGLAAFQRRFRKVS